MLTGGGDCPGLNAVMRAVVRKGERVYGDQLVGFRDGWRGAIEDDLGPLSVESFRGTLPRGGTILGSSRTNPYKVRTAGVEAVKATLAEQRHRRPRRHRRRGHAGRGAPGWPPRASHVVGVPKTIDNDLSATELTFGFDTAVQVCVDAIDRLHTTAESHDRVMVVEVMGRHAGPHRHLGGHRRRRHHGAHPRARPSTSTRCARVIQHATSAGATPRSWWWPRAPSPRRARWRPLSGEVDAFGHVRLGGIGDTLAKAIEERTGYETRAIVLGHVQRGGTPTAFDRVLATRFGIAAIDAVHDGDFGTMVALRAGDIVRVPLDEATGELKLVDPAVYDVASGVLRLSCFARGRPGP